MLKLSKFNSLAKYCLMSLVNECLCQDKSKVATKPKPDNKVIKKNDNSSPIANSQTGINTSNLMVN